MADDDLTPHDPQDPTKGQDQNLRNLPRIIPINIED